MSTPKTRDFETSVELEATPEEVFRAVTDGTEIAKWLAPEAGSTPPEGGKKGTVWVSWGEGMKAERELEIYDSPRHVRHQAGENGETHAPLYVDWIIEAHEGGQTTLRLVHSGFSTGAEWDDEFECHGRGWKLMLTNLRHYFARHPHEPAVHLVAPQSVEQPRAALWKKLLALVGLPAAAKVGDAFRFTTPKGEALTGTADFVIDGHDLGLVVRERGDALLRFNLMGKPEDPATFVFGYAIAYGENRERAGELNESVPLA